MLVGDDDPAGIDDEARAVGLHPTRQVAGFCRRLTFHVEMFTTAGVAFCAAVASPLSMARAKHRLARARQHDEYDKSHDQNAEHRASPITSDRPTPSYQASVVNLHPRDGGRERRFNRHATASGPMPELRRDSEHRLRRNAPARKRSSMAILRRNAPAISATAIRLRAFALGDRGAEHREQQAGVDRVAHPAIRAGADQLVILFQRHRATPVATE